MTKTNPELFSLLHTAVDEIEDRFNRLVSVKKPKPREFYICWDDDDDKPLAYYTDEEVPNYWDHKIKVREVDE